MSKALYRKYRSKTLDEVIGQKHITDILSRALSQGKISHAYLLTGPRGVGKTSVARILAHEINGLLYDEDVTNLDIIEIDAASNNGVEDVRDLREKVQIAPASAKKKVYIIDEVHMLSKAAFNALLKTLEEPPEHVVFILATTNVEKLPATIISRAQRFSFRPISIDDAVKHLAYIAKQENIKIDDGALKLIAERSDGSFRDSISLLDQLSNIVSSENKIITTKLIEDTLGLAPQQMIMQILEAVENRDISAMVAILNNAFNEGVSSAILVAQLIEVIRGQITDKPQLLPLMDALIDVTKSPQPQLKLLSVLGMAAAPKQPKSAALLTPVLEVSASIAELTKVEDGLSIIDYRMSRKTKAEKKQKIGSATNIGLKTLEDKATEETPVDDKMGSSNNEPQSSRSAIISSDTLEPELEPTSGLDSSPARSSVAKDDSRKGEHLDWDKLIEYTRQNYIALYSVLVKCSYQLDGDQLTLYTVNKFYKNKLDDNKYRPLLSQCLQEIGVYGLDIHTIPTTSPLKDSQAAAIAAIMGGGVEVSLESA